MDFEFINGYEKYNDRLKYLLAHEHLEEIIQETEIAPNKMQVEALNNLRTLRFEKK